MIYGYTYGDPELWAPIWDIPKYYVSTWGRVININRGSEVKGTAYNRDYPLRINFRITRQDATTRFVHRLVAEAFMANFKPYKQVTFLDGDRWNPHILNLELKSGVSGMFLGGSEWIPLRKLQRSDGKLFNSVSEAAKETEAVESEIYDNLRGDRSHIKGVTYEWIWIEVMPDGVEFVSRPGTRVGSAF